MRFSLRWMLIATTFAVIYAGLLFAVPQKIGMAGMAIASAAILGFAVGGSFYAKSDERAFWLGCLLTSIPCPFLVAIDLYFFNYTLIQSRSYMDRDIPIIMFTLAACHLASLISGGVCVLARRTFGEEN